MCCCFLALQDLQGEVESYFLKVDSARSREMFTFSPNTTSTEISDLWPSTMYSVALHVSNGAHNTTKAIVNITTADGGMSKLGRLLMCLTTSSYNHHFICLYEFVFIEYVVHK